MEEPSTRGMTRRDILKGGLGVTLVASCFTLRELRNACAAAGATGKPLLIEPELNARIPSPKNRQAYLAAMEFAKRDLLGYLTANFQMTQQQIAEVRSIPQQDRERLNAFLDRAQANNLRITVRIMPGKSAGAPSLNAVYLHMRSGQPLQPPSAMAKTRPEGEEVLEKVVGFFAG